MAKESDHLRDGRLARRFERLTYENGVYRTRPVPVPFFSRVMPSLACYPSVLSCIYRLSIAAKGPKYSRDDLIRHSLGVLRALERVGVSVEITGIDNVRTLQGPCVFASNHMSTLETLVLPTIIAPFREVTFVVKQSLVEYPIFGRIMKAMNPIGVGRKNPRDDLRAVLEGGRERLNLGISLVIFPESVRTAIFEPRKFNTIATKLARDAGVPVVPVALKTDAWGVGRLFSDFGKIDPSKKVYFAFGTPVRVEGRGSDAHNQAISFIAQKLKEWEG